jgi:UDP-N-acetylmuramyl tripeptide synthase
MSKPYITLLGKAVRYVARLRGGGSALPGLFVEKIDPDFIRHTLATLPRGVVVISGTNGKTTTTKMVVQLLESQGLRVFTNRTGSNFTRGVAAALLGEVDNRGNLDADIAVLELDEAHAVQFVKSIPPRYSLLLNVMRDQLDRFGEIDATAKLLQQIASHTSGTVILNREDPRVAAIASKLHGQTVGYFGLSPQLTKLFPSDDDLHGTAAISKNTPAADVILQAIKNDQAQFVIDGDPVTVRLQLQGVYNIYNAAAALALVRAVVGDSIDQAKLLDTLSQVTPAFGRGETVLIGGQPLELVLVKNPSGFRLGLSSFNPAGYQTMIAINDNYADGRDMSWLWDVSFESLRDGGVLQVSGIRAYDMALRLQYDEVPLTHIGTNLPNALQRFISQSGDQPKRIYCTYTAMLALRRELAKMTNIEEIA